MISQKILSEAVVTAAKGVSKVVLGKLLQSVKGENRGVIVPYRSEGNNNIICFVHGFCGNPEETFTPMPKFIVEESELNGWDIMSIGYASSLMPNIGKGLWAADPDISKIAHYLQTNLEIINESYNRVALVGHSMGGLVIQKALLNMSDIHKVSHVLFYGTPSGGLKKAWFVRWFNGQVNDMDQKGPFIKALRDGWNEKFKAGYPFKFATVAGELDEFVPVVSSLDPFANEYRSYTAGNHVSMVKPGTSADTSFQILKKILRNDNDALLGCDEKELNNLIAKYHEEVFNLGGKSEKLDKNGFRKYIFALEGTGKLDTAIQVIEESEIIKTNTDFMGILGGRWKRKYLIEEEAGYLQNAINWYKKALELSITANDSSQIYYHAINLAFLYCMQEDTDHSQSKKMAKLALEHCEQFNDGHYWEIATRAEAYLYLNDFTNSKKLYSEAIDKCGSDIRAKSSIMINALYACNRLGWDDLKKELEKIFNKEDCEE